MEIIKFETHSGSIYEVDTANQKVRRVSGKKKIDYLIDFSTWQPYVSITTPAVGKNISILWNIDLKDERFFGRAPITITSQIVKMLGE